MSFWSRLRSEFADFQKEQDENPDRVTAFLRRSESTLREFREGLFENVPFQCKNFHSQAYERDYLIFIDGTGNDPSMDYDGNPKSASTNVYRLFRCIDQGEKCLARYFPGVGSQKDDPNPVSAVFRKFGGKGADRIMDMAYLQLLTDYCPGDRIFLFGFSRGAAIARMLANKIHEEGIRERGIARYVDFSQSDNLLLDKVELEGARRDVDIEVLGVWDTVAAFGIPTNQYEPFKNLTVAKNVKKVYHLVSIDEDRQPFQPTLMNAEKRIEEIWFPGVHADVGGGYANRDLADITLQFMRNRLKDHEIGLLPPEKKIAPKPDGLIHTHEKSPISKELRKVQVKGEQSTKVRIHKSSLDRRREVSSYRPAELERLITTRDYAEDVRI